MSSMTIREKVARAIARAQLERQYIGNLKNIGVVIEIDHIWPEFTPEVTAAITAFLEAAAEKGWHLMKDEPTETMREAGMEAAPLNYYEDKASSRQRISMDTDEVGPVYRAMLAACPSFEWDK